MATEIPTFVDESSYTLSVDLDGEAFDLRLVWSARAACWLLDIRDLDGNAVVLGKPMVVGNLLTLGIGRPAGQLCVIGDRDPQRYDLGTRCKLVYIDAVDVPEEGGDFVLPEVP